MKSGNSAYRLGDENSVIIIPVVVHILHSPGEGIGVGSNLSVAQIQSQIDVINEDYSRTNADASNTKPEWQGFAQNPKFEFRLACVDPNNNSTTGITRKAAPSANTVYNVDNNNAKSNATGGRDPWPTDRYLNVWVVNNLSDNDGRAVFGDGQFPSLYAASPNTDGIVIIRKVFGRGLFDLEFSNNKGRVLTHEIGHWLNVLHIFEGGCSGTDFCADTPPQREPTSSCPNFTQTSCNNDGNMYQNYMDYSYDNCKNLFTNDQVLRMRAIFQSGGVRRSFIDNYLSLSKATLFDPTYGLPQTLYNGDSKDVPVNKTITLTIENPIAIGTPTVTLNYTPLNFMWSQSGNVISFRFSRTNQASYRTVTFNVTTNTNCGALASSYTFNNFNSGFYFRISPNPASDFLTVKSLEVDIENSNNRNNDKPPKYDVNIYDNTNRLVKQIKNLEGFDEKQIDISSLPHTQHYNVQIISEQNVSVHKIFKF
jgi:Pregnancy-associated plasma protein-A/Secretion system C-terminal sorting domain